MEIDRTISQTWQVSINEKEILERFVDESVIFARRATASQKPSILVGEDDKAIIHRYYCSALAELSSVLARRTRRVGGSIVNTTDPQSKLLITVYTLPMTQNHESELAGTLGDHCQEFLISRLLEKWYGQGTDFGSAEHKDGIKHVLNYRRVPIERPFSIL